MNYKKFDFSGVGINNGNFLGFPYSKLDAQIIIQPVAWDVTTSYGGGTANGPDAIIDASVQLDVTDLDVPNAHKMGLAVADHIPNIQNQNQKYRLLAKSIIDNLEAGLKADKLSLIHI